MSAVCSSAEACGEVRCYVGVLEQAMNGLLRANLEQPDAVELLARLGRNPNLIRLVAAARQAHHATRLPPQPGHQPYTGDSPT